MNKTEYLLTKLMEECGEVVRIASKYQRFGRDSYNPNDNDPETNETSLINELGDLIAVMELLVENDIIYGNPDGLYIDAKKQITLQFMERSRQLGLLE